MLYKYVFINLLKALIKKTIESNLRNLLMSFEVNKSKNIVAVIILRLNFNCRSKVDSKLH